ncbi:MAG: hypothetical protein J5950_06720 [Clostridia bacterium]|nr:hypothetical protein [Clostridia bacterium]
MPVLFPVLLAVSLILAALYIAGVIKPPLAAKTIASLAFVALGAFLLFRSPPHTAFRLLIFLGLVFGAAGDVLLELFDQSSKKFLIGVFAFFTGHAMYIAAFFTRNAPGALLALLFAFPAAALLTILSARLLVFEGVMRIALLGYMFALSFMTSFAWVTLVMTGLKPFLLLAPGAALFLLSDTSLGLMMFGKPAIRKHSRLLGAICLITYYLAQNAIASSLLF